MAPNDEAYRAAIAELRQKAAANREAEASLKADSSPEADTSASEHRSEEDAQKSHEEWRKKNKNMLRPPCIPPNHESTSITAMRSPTITLSSSEKDLTEQMEKDLTWQVPEAEQSWTDVTFSDYSEEAQKAHEELVSDILRASGDAINEVVDSPIEHKSVDAVFKSEPLEATQSDGAVEVNCMDSMVAQSSMPNGVASPSKAESLANPPQSVRRRRRPCCLSNILFWWVNPLVATSLKKAVGRDELREVPERSQVDRLVTTFDDLWHPENLSPEVLQGNAYLLHILRRMFRFRLYLAGLLMFVHSACQLAVPFLMRRYLEWFMDGKVTESHGWIHIAGCALCMFIGNAICSNHANLQLYVIGMDLRTLFMALVYRKSTRLSHKARADIDIADIFRLISVDCEQLPMTIVNIHSIWIAPIFMIAATVLLFMTVGLAAVVGIGIMLLVLPLPLSTGKAHAEVSNTRVGHAGKRARATNEALNSILLLKYFSWDKAYKDMIDKLRTSELVSLRRMARLQGLMMSIMMATPLIIGYALVVATFLIDISVFTPARVFTGLICLNLIRIHLGMLPMAFQGHTELKSSLSRFQSFLQAEEMKVPLLAQRAPGSEVDNTSRKMGDISVLGASFRWPIASANEKALVEKRDENPTKSIVTAEEAKAGVMPLASKIPLSAPSPASNVTAFCLHCINISVKAGQLLAIVGKRGSGKSSLLNALVHEMPKVGGDMSLGDSIAYCSQEPWIFNGSLRDNILFNKEMEAEEYRQVLEMCGLTVDCAALPHGDQTDIGSNSSVNIREEQKIRIALARACYSGASIYIFDDVIALLDEETGSHILKNCILRLADRGKTVVMVTDTAHLHMLPKKHMLCILNEGRIKAFKNLAFVSLSSAIVRSCEFGPKEFASSRQDRSPKEFTSSRQEFISSSMTSCDPQLFNTNQGFKFTFREYSCRHRETTSAAKQADRDDAVKWRTCYHYLAGSRGGCCGFVPMLFILIISQAFGNAFDWWLCHWSNSVLEDNVTPHDEFLERAPIVYTCLGLAATACVLCRNMFLARLLFRRSRSFYEMLANSIFCASMESFEALPVSEIASLLNHDMENLDVQLHRCFPTFATRLLDVAGLFVTIGICIPLLCFALVPLLICYWYVQRCFRPLGRELQSLEAASRLPLFHQFHDSLNGIATIRAYGRSQQFIDKYSQRINFSNRAFFTLHNANRWLQLHLEIIESLLFVAVGCFTMHGRSQGTLSVGIAGLTLFYAVSCSQCSAFSFTVRMASETEAKMSSVKRIYDWLATVKMQAPLVSDARPSATWPMSGCIKFQDVSMRYAAGLPLVLKNLSFHIEGGAKVGICGQTGSGKSSIFSTLLRMNDIFLDDSCGKGSILLDDVNIGSIGLHDLRMVVSIIPQQVIMFSGSLKDNLDFSGEHTHEEMWRALRCASVEEMVMRLPEGLAAQVQTGGTNFSFAERQLFCLARILLRRPAVVCFDETDATAEIDTKTNTTVQSIIRSSLRTECSSSTVLISTHSPQTLGHCDQIIVLENGSVVECDTPSNLLDIGPQGKFYTLVSEKGDEAFTNFEVEAKCICPVLEVAPNDAGMVSL